jgi:phenylacetate-CoA ligase
MRVPPDNRRALAGMQLEQLRELLATLRSANPFQTRRIESAGAPWTVESLAEFTERFPFTTKGDLAADAALNPPYGTNLTFPLDHYSRFHQTSGTTGQPLRWLDTAESWDAMVMGWTRVFAAAEVKASDRVLFAFTFGPFLGFWMAFEAAQRLGCLALPGGGLSSASRLQMILDNGVTVLCCTPTYAARLAEVAEAENIDLRAAKVRRLLVAGEPGGSIPPIRARLSRLWNGARVYDHHGMTEVGPVTYECPVTPERLHVMEADFLTEVIDPATGAPSLPGETGELILTTLTRTGSPVLRYRTGDLVQPVNLPGDEHATPCACGSVELSLDGGILGRVDDMVIVRGVNVHPAALESILHECGGVAEYQVEVFSTATRSELSLRIEARAGEGEPGEVARRVQKAIQNRLHLRVPVVAVPGGSLPRYEMKARRWLRSAPAPEVSSTHPGREDGG